MACKACASENLRELEGELSASLTDIKRLEVPPVYVCQRVVVCLDCGFAHTFIPASELELLKKGLAASGS
jgi:hypothetical protein